MSLIEMITALVIFSAVAGALYAGFNQGLRLWKKSMEPDARWDQALFFEDFKAAFRNAYVEEKKGFEGGGADVAFLTHVRESRFRGSSQPERPQTVPARIRYFFDDSRKAVIEQTEFYEKILNPKAGQSFEEKESLRGVTAFKIEYFQRLKKESVSAARWISKWSRDCMPEAVKITVESGEGSLNRMTRVIAFPGAGLCSEPGKV